MILVYLYLSHRFGKKTSEGIKINFLPDGVRRIAEIAWHVNERVENIGARRLHTVLERLLEEISYTASDRAEKEIKNAQDYFHI